MNRFLFSISTVMVLLLLALENLVGIHWDFHPDAVTYTTESFDTVQNIMDSGFLSAFNNFYYFVAAIFQQDAAILVIFNIGIYAITNVIIYNKINEILLINSIKFNYKIFLFLICLLFMPYRLHLAAHVLKDTLIIFFLINLMTKNKINWVINGFFIAGLRLFSLAYMSIFIKKKYFYFGVILVSVVALYNLEELTLILEDKNDVNMTFRDFDAVPNFTSYGLFGVFLRAVIWPIFAFSGGYLLLSPSLAFAPLALGSIAITVTSWWALKKAPINLQSLMVFAVIALLTTGFTTYIRYCFPLLVLMPIFQFKEFAKANKVI